MFFRYLFINDRIFLENSNYNIFNLADIGYYDKWLLVEAFPLIFISFLLLLYISARLFLHFVPQYVISFDELDINNSDHTLKKYNVPVSYFYH